MNGSADVQVSDPLDLLIERERQEILYALIDSEPERVGTVLRHRLGLDGETPKTYSEIGKILGCTGSNVRYIERKALRRIRGFCHYVLSEENLDTLSDDAKEYCGRLQMTRRKLPMDHPWNSSWAFGHQ